MNLEIAIGLLSTLAVGLNGWALSRLVNLDSKFADLNRWINEKVIFDAQRHQTNVDSLKSLMEEVVRCRERLHKLEGSVTNREEAFNDILDRLHIKQEECDRYKKEIEDLRKRKD